MTKQKKIVFKVSEFPHMSETFILAQIITAINLGYETKIIVGKLLDIKNSLYEKTLIEYGILDNIIIENYNIPKNKFVRLMKFIFLLFKNVRKINAIKNFYRNQKSFSLTWLYQWCFYEAFNSINTVFHIQYGTNRNPLDLFKTSRHFKPSLIVTFHGHDAFFPINGFIPNDGYYNNLFNFGELITANTPYLSEKIITLGCPKDKLKIIPVGVDTVFFHPIKNNKNVDETLKIITVGRLDPVKGHRYSIEAIKKAVEKGYNVTLTIVGEGEERENLEALIENNNLNKHVFLLGRKSQKEIRSLLWEHDLYILTAVPLIDGRRETQGLATLEAQACGLPIIAFDSGGVKYTINEEKTGFVCEEYNVVEIVDKIEILYNDRDLLNKMSNNTKKFIDDNYSQIFINSIWQDTYKNLFKKWIN